MLVKKDSYGQGKYGSDAYSIHARYDDTLAQIVQKRIDEDLQYFRDKIDKAFKIK